MLRSVVFLLAAVCLSACSAGTVSRSDGAPSAAPSEAPALPSAPPSPTAVGTPDPTAAAALEPTAAPAASETPLGPIVSTAADHLRVRSLPRVSDDSIQREPLLPLHTRLVVLGGPVTASGYTWYDVAPLASRTLPLGWVAAGSRTGEPWLVTADFDCPAMPNDFRTLSAMIPAVGLACFPRMPITVRARMVPCDCDVDGPTYVPAWFSVGDARLIVEPGASRPPTDVSQWFFLYLDPTGDYPKVLPTDGLVDVTGIFDHPAATGCTSSGMDERPTPVDDCRLRFAVIRLTAIGS